MITDMTKKRYKMFDLLLTRISEQQDVALPTSRP